MSDDNADIEAEAAEWVVKALSGDIGDGDVLALTAWVETSPRHAEAYRHALALWAGLEEEAPPSQPYVPSRVARASAGRPWRFAFAGAGAAVLCALAVSFVVLRPAPATFYETAHGERREVALADGTHLTLNTDTRLGVRLSNGRRELTLEKGEVALNVVHDARRPFVLSSGGLKITDIGTEFNVSRLDGVVNVAVREGEVSLMVPGHKAATLRAGDYGIHAEATGHETFGRIDPREAFAWTNAHAIYRNQPLSVVVRDLNRYFDTPIVVDDAAGQQRLSTILTLDSQDAVVGRLREFLPLEVRTTHEAIYLSLRPGATAASGGNGR